MLEHLQTFNIAQAADRIATNAHTGGLPNTECRQLPDRLIGERAATGDDPNAPRPMNMTWHDTSLCFTGRNNARTIGANQTGLLADQIPSYHHHIEDRYAIGDTDNEFDAGLHRF